MWRAAGKGGSSEIIGITEIAVKSTASESEVEFGGGGVSTFAQEQIKDIAKQHNIIGIEYFFIIVSVQ
jgi:hypothetical protein